MKKHKGISYAKWGYLFILPFFVVYLIFSFLPQALTIYNSFFDNYRQGLTQIGPTFVGFKNYIKLFTSAGSSSINFPRWFINTFVVAIFSCIISTISVLAVSYTFSRLRFGARKKLMNVAMILGMFPGFMTMIAIYYLLKAMGLNQNLIALVICYSSGAGLGFQIS